MPNNKCQIHCLNQIALPLNVTQVFWQRRNRIKRILKRRLNYIKNWLFTLTGLKKTKIIDEAKSSVVKNLQPGDMVFVRSKEEIQSTLNRWNQLKGCSFMVEMWPYCGTRQRVLKKVKKFLDERDYLLKKCSGIVILENVICQGTKDFGSCDRSCFFFWREEWLEKDR